MKKQKTSGEDHDSADYRQNLFEKCVQHYHSYGIRCAQIEECLGKAPYTYQYRLPMQRMIQITRYYSVEQLQEFLKSLRLIEEHLSDDEHKYMDFVEDFEKPEVSIDNKWECVKKSVGRSLKKLKEFGKSTVKEALFVSK